jgi:hypothetical protein
MSAGRVGTPEPCHRTIATYYSFESLAVTAAPKTREQLLCQRAKRAKASGIDGPEKADFPSFQGHGHQFQIHLSILDTGRSRAGKFAQMPQIARAQMLPDLRRCPAQSMLNFPRHTLLV